MYKERERDGWRRERGRGGIDRGGWRREGEERIKEEARHTRVNIIAAPILSFAYIDPLIHSHIFSSSFSCFLFFSFVIPAVSEISPNQTSHVR